MATARPAQKRPKLGQNFLVDTGAAARIVEALGNVSSKVVIEIGPGRGVLTEPLSRRAGHLIAIELDRVMAAQLRMQYARHETVEIIEADVLKVQFDTILGPRPGMLTGIASPRIEAARVVGNIPYYITSDLLLHLFDYHTWFDSLVIMTQLEVADRVAATPGTRDYGLLSATAQLYAHVEKLFTLPPGAFAPAPKVHSAVLRFTMQPRWEQLRIEPAPFIEFLKLCFGQKRKTLANNLRTKYDQKTVLAALAAAKVEPSARAEAITLEKSAAVFRAFSNQ
jgi:16S rRNA (adenine1518-N6/adenine1519-N6)-dimethyltransferase